MPQVTHLDLPGPMQDWEMRRQNAHERATSRNHRRRLHRPNSSPRKDFTTWDKLLIRGHVLNDTRAALPKRAPARAHPCAIDSLEEFEDPVAKTAKRFDLNITKHPVHWLHTPLAR